MRISQFLLFSVVGFLAFSSAPSRVQAQSESESEGSSLFVPDVDTEVSLDTWEDDGASEMIERPSEFPTEYEDEQEEEEFESETASASPPSNLLDRLTALLPPVEKLSAFSQASSDYLARFDANLDVLANDRKQPKLLRGQLAAAKRVFEHGEALSSTLYKASQLPETYPDYEENTDKTRQLISDLQSGAVRAEPWIIAEFIARLRASLAVFQYKIYQAYTQAIYETRRPSTQLGLIDSHRFKKRVELLNKEVENNYKGNSAESYMTIMQRYIFLGK